MNGGDQYADEPEDEEDDDEGGGAEDAVLEGGGVADEAEAQLNADKLRMLLEALSRDQSDRYDTWRRVRLNKGTVRRVRTRPPAALE